MPGAHNLLPSHSLRPTVCTSGAGNQQRNVRCGTVNCRVHFASNGHRHCCTDCRLSHGRFHGRRCRNEQRLCRMDGERLALQHFECLTLGCTRLVAGSHLHCCSTCRHSSGAIHTHRCNLALLRSTPFHHAGAQTGQQNIIAPAPHHGSLTTDAVENAATLAPVSMSMAQSSSSVLPPTADQDSTTVQTEDPAGTVSASAVQHIAEQSHVHSGHTLFVSSDEEEANLHNAETVEAFNLNDLD